MTNNERLYKRAVSFLGVDASPKDTVSDELACVESLEEVYHTEFGQYLGGYKLVSTIKLYEALRYDPRFREVKIPKIGDIIVSPTESNTKIGHCGIVGKYGILANDSRSGLWLEGYSIESWRIYFEQKLKLKVYFFEIKE